MGKVPLRRRGLVRGGFLRTPAARAEPQVVPWPGMGVPATAPAPARRGKERCSRPGLTSTIAWPANDRPAFSLSRVSARGGEVGSEGMELEEDQVRKNGWGRRNGRMRKGKQRKEPGSSTHGALLRRDLPCSAYPWGGKGRGRNRLKPPCRLYNSTSILRGEKK